MTLKESRFFGSKGNIPKASRFVLITHLCLAFTVLFWSAALPFMQNYFDQRSLTLLYQTVLGVDEEGVLYPIHRSDEGHAQLLLDAELFADLPKEEQVSIRSSYQKLIKENNESWLEQLALASRILAFGTPAFLQGWVLFSIIIGTMLLLRKEGAAQAVWILPILVGLYSLDNRLYAPLPNPPADFHLYPTEELVLSKYLNEDLDEDFFNQHEQLLRGWHMFLVIEYTKETPSENPLELKKQIDKGEFYFNLDRLKAFQRDTGNHPLFFQSFRKPYFLLALFIIWNVFVAWFVNRPKALEPQY
ncbi:MAG: hypothetical protein CMO81_12090 [Waddliaceae bacterium]|nr:hypothetical protein [Waddliaceae bacterium]